MSAPDHLLENVNLMIELGVALAFLRNFTNRMHHGRVVASAEVLSDLGQAVVLMLGIVPVLLLCRRFGFSGKLTVGVSLLYAFYPLLATGCF